MKSNNTLWALCILLGALAFGVLFIVPRYLDEPAGPASVAETAPSADAAGDGAEGATAEADSGAPPAGEPAPSEQAAAEDPAGDLSAPDAGTEPGTEAIAEGDATVPAFDILRVEPDGSTVIAGRAAPGAMLEVLNGDDVVASTEVGQEGNFAAVFDEPLAPGDYQLSLRTTDERSNATTLSDEVATISIPEDDESELLAMITRPGKASRIIAQPEVQTPAAEEEIASAEPLSQPEADGATAPSSDPAAAEGEEPAAGSETEMAAVDPTEPAAIRAPEAGAAPGATAGQEPAASPSSPAAQSDVTVRIDAVEVEGDRLFITGSASPDLGVQIYANEALVGAAGTEADGRFLVEGTMPLPVGENTIRADLLSQGRVVARAIVPFNRPEGEAASAVAAAEEPAPPAAPVIASSGDEASPAEETVSGPEADRPSSAEPEREVAAADPTPAATQPGPVDQNAGAGSAQGEASPPPSSEPANGVTGLETADDGSTEPADEPVTIQQAALEPSDSSVIIRRGDTLWQISRRVYGQGVRYTTIYLANESQIADPDRILPGQVFSVPEEALENAEELHRQRVLQ
jgi:nucleoid-associated protein YgaU